MEFPRVDRARHQPCPAWNQNKITRFIVDNMGIILQIACAIEQRDEKLAELLKRRHISGA